MWKNYLVITIRNNFRNKLHSVINVTGFAIGLASCLLISFYVINELSYEKFHENRDFIYRVPVYLSQGGTEIGFASAMPILGPTLQKDFPEVESFVRIRKTEEVIIKHEDKEIIEDNFVYTEPSFFQLFSFDFKYGSKENSLIEPYSLIISQKTKNKYFPDFNPINNIIVVNGNEFKITGVLDKLKGNTQLDFDFIASYSTLKSLGLYQENWGQFGVDQNFILLNDNADYTELKMKLPDFVQRNVTDGLAQLIKFDLQPFNDLYFHSALNNEFTPSGNLQQVSLFAIVAFLLILIASLNFINLSTAKSLHRAKEVGMRKVFGSSRARLIRQFLLESIVLTLIAMFFAIVLFRFLSPALNNFIGKELEYSTLSNPMSYLFLSAMSIIIGILAGLYPAFFLSRYVPISAIKSQNTKQKNGLRTILVVIQFTIAVSLIMLTTMVYKQLDFVTKIDTGFNNKNILFISLHDEELRSKIGLLKEQIEKLNNVNLVSRCFSPPGTSYAMLMNINKEGGETDDGMMINVLSCDENYFDLLDIKIDSGRGFSSEFTSDKDNSVIINQSAAKKLNFDNPIGKKLMVPSQNHSLEPREIIGLVSDYNYHSLKNKVEPLLIFMEEDSQNSLLIKYNDNSAKEVYDAVESIWEKIYPDEDINMHFLDEYNEMMYRAEQKMGKLFVFFSVVIGFVACLGIFGLSSFVAEQKNREIGIRKVLGATSSEIVKMLNMEFIKLVFISYLFALPISYYSSSYILKGFAYKTTFNGYVLIIGGVIILILALATISIQSLKAALKNPAETIKYE